MHERGVVVDNEPRQRGCIFLNNDMKGIVTRSIHDLKILALRVLEEFVEDVFSACIVHGPVLDVQRSDPGSVPP
jgi:hypothetical protein